MQHSQMSANPAKKTLQAKRAKHKLVERQDLNQRNLKLDARLNWLCQLSEPLPLRRRDEVVLSDEV